MIEYFISGFIGSLVGTAIYAYFRKPKIEFVNESKMWMDIDCFPIPENKKYFIVTDGKSVEYMYKPVFNSRGDVVFDYPHRVATHWMNLPSCNSLRY